MAKHKVAIVGAGIAGLSACSALIEAGIDDVIILEAEGRIGGRVYSSEQDDCVLELGANWLHYSSTSLYSLCESHGLIKSTVDLNEASVLFSETDKPVSSFDQKNQIVGEAMRVINLAEKLRPTDIVTDFLLGSNNFKQNVADLECALSDILLEKEALPTKHDNKIAGVDLGLRIILATAGAPSLADISCVGLREETGSGAYRTQLNVPLSVMIDKIGVNIPKEAILLNCQVQNIKYSPDKAARPISVTYTASDNRLNMILADHVIFTASVGVLKAKHTTLFSPPLSQPKQRAIELFGFGNLGKIFFRYSLDSMAWWRNQLQRWDCSKNGDAASFSLSMVYTTERSWYSTAIAGTGQSCNEAHNNWTRQIPGVYFIPVRKIMSSATDGTELLFDHSWCMVYVPDSVSHVVNNLSDEQVLTDFNEFMKKTTGASGAPNAERVVRCRWGSQPNCQGTYSYCSVACAREFGTSGANILAEPEWIYNSRNEAINDKDDENARFLPRLLFAGEATYTAGLGYMHGAYETGLREARRIIAARSKVIGE